MSKKQSTLFQSWGQKKKEASETKKCSDQRGRHVTASEGVIDLCLDEDDEDDDLLAQALEASVIDPGQKGNPRPTSPTIIPGPSTISAADDDICNISIGAETFSCTQGSTQTKAPEGFDKFAGKLWIYPTNYPVREYQYSIVKQSLFNNTMVTLPTGLGKTFIASVVMYNFYRWYPLGKVVFMAPTKPLVAQQIEACYKIMGIPQTDTAEMTGNMPPQERRKAWNDKRVFFLTPQVLTNDLSRGTCPAVLVKCLVVDEAHKALGNHAYCQVVRELVKYTREFRILALSATPGSDIKAVQQVLANLLISHIEIRTEESADIKQYSHERKVEKIVVPLGDELTLVKTKYLQIMDVVVGRLKRQGVIYNRDTKSLSKFLILKAREAFRQNPPERVQRSQFGIIEGDFALAMSLFHGYELLQLHGLRSLYNFLDGIISGEKGHGRTRTELMKNADFNSLMEMLQEKFLPAECRPSQASQSSKKPFVTGHPKMEKLKEVVLEHFDKFHKAEENKGRATRIMIFSQYRDSVTEIKDMLQQHYPVVKVMSFIGQSSAGKATKGFTQKEQLKVMKEFRDGGYNTLVSTCVGEEGLDIGEVDLIICFDAHKSPIRLVQRMGRTGRKREGRIVMLVTQGKEEQIYNQSQYSKKSIHKAILNGARSLNFYQCNPCMVPDGWDPQCHKMFITVKETFKPAKSDDKNNKITKMLNTNSDRKVALSVDDGLLTEEQYKDWKENYAVSKEELKKLKLKSKFLSLSTDTEENSDEIGESENFLSLNKWLLWQNRQQTAYVMGHSERSKHLVELVEFIELQESLDPNEDNYGQEMELFLNEDDIIKPGERIQNEGDGKITNFLTSKSTNETNKKPLKKKVVRRSNLLRDFESDKEQEESDEEFPAICLDSEEVNKTKPEGETTENRDNLQQQADTDIICRIDKVAHCKSRDNPDVEKESRSTKAGTDVDEIGFKSGINRIKRKSTKKLQENRMVEKELTFDDNRKKTKCKKKDKKKRYSSGNATVVQIIANNSDGSDFDDNNGHVPDISVNVDTKPESVKEISGHDIEKQLEDIVPVLEPVEIEDKNKNNISDMETDECDKDNGEFSFSQLFPVFDTKKQSVRKSQNKNESWAEFQIPSPPSVQELKVIIDSLGNEKTLPKINLEHLVEEWRKEDLFCKKKTSVEENSTPVDFLETKNCENFKGQKNKEKNVNGISDSSLSVHTGVILPQPSEIETYRTLSNFVLNQNIDVSKKNPENHKNVLSEIENSEMCAKDKICDSDKSIQKSPLVSEVQVEKSSSDSDNEDILIDTQANFMLTCDDQFLKDISINDSKIMSMSESSSSVKSGNSSVLSHPEDILNEKQDDSENKVDFVGENATKFKKPLFKESSSVKVKEPCLETQESAELKRQSFTYPSSVAMNEKFSDKKTVNNPDLPQKNSESALHQVNPELVSEELKNAEQKACEVKDFVNPEKQFVSANNFQMSKKDPLNSSNQQTPVHATNMSSSLFDDSLFKDEMSDETFLAMKTPLSSNKQNVKNLDLESQVTFTQALACVHSGSEGSPTDIQEVTGPKPAEEDFDKGRVTSDISSFQNKIVKTNFNVLSKNKISWTNENLKQNSNVDDEISVDLVTQGEISKQCNLKKGNADDQEKVISKSSEGFDNSGDDEDDDDEMDLPTFDLGFNIDEDIIPPSPCNTQSFSQLSFSKSLSQSLIRSRKSLSTILGTSVDNFKEKKAVAHKFDKDKIVPIMEENQRQVEIKEEQVKTDFKVTSVPKENENVLSVNEISKIDSQNGGKFKKGDISSEKETDLECKVNFDCDVTFDHLEDGPTSPILSGRKISILKNSPESPSLDDSMVVRKKRRVTIIDSPETPGIKDTEHEVSFNDSFVVRKKHRVAIIDSPETPDPCSTSINEEENPFEFKTPVRPVCNKRKSKMTASNHNNLDGDIDLIRVKERKKLSVSFRDMTTTKFIDDDDDDFQDGGKDMHKISYKVSEGRKKEKSVTGLKENKSEQKKFTGIKPRKSKSPADMFIVGEADVSDEDDVEISDDEADDSDLDHMEDSFIHEGTQLSQDCSEDMHAIYLKSVRSPALSGGNRFKLKYDHANFDVFSQAPRGEDEEESQYIDDSFCVDDDYEETMVDIDEEVELCKDLNDTTFVGRRTRWSKPVKKANKKLIKTDKRMKRIRTMVDSSSDEEINKLGHVSKITISPGESPKSSTSFRPKKRQILSSSDDEGFNNMKNKSETSPEMLSLRSRVGNDTNSKTESAGNNLSICHQSSENNERPLQSLSDSGSQEIMLSLKSRINKAGNAKTLSVFSDQSRTSSHDRANMYTDLKTSTSSSIHNISGKYVDSSSLADKTKEERLRRQKEKQEEFKRKMAEKQNVMLNKNQGVTYGEIKTAKLSNQYVENVSNADVVISPESKSKHIDSVSSLQCNNDEKLVILVDSKELNGAQDIVSDLRFEHNSNVVAAQLLGCDYVISNRMGVDRQQWAEFSNGSNRNKLIEKIQTMCELYDRPCLLIEKDRIKGDVKGGSSRPLHWTKYVDRTLAQLIKSKVTLHFTESQKETAAMLAELCKLEQRKNLSINVPTDLNIEKQQQAKFYCSFPSLSYVHSLNLCYNFKSISQFLSSDIDDIKNKGKMSEKRATEIYNYIRRTFDTQMLPTSFG